MANRSDFFQAKLPRQYKRMLALAYATDQHGHGAAKRAFIDAHKAHVAFKLKRGQEDAVDTTEAE